MDIDNHFIGTGTLLHSVPHYCCCLVTALVVAEALKNNGFRYCPQLLLKYVGVK